MKEKLVYSNDTMIDSLKAKVYKNSIEQPIGQMAKSQDKREFSMSMKSSKYNKKKSFSINSAKNTERKFVIVDKLSTIANLKNTM